MKLIDLGIDAQGPITAEKLASGSAADVLLVGKSSISYATCFIGIEITDKISAHHESPHQHGHLQRVGQPHIHRHPTCESMDYRFSTTRSRHSLVRL